MKLIVLAVIFALFPIQSFASGPATGGGGGREGNRNEKCASAKTPRENQGSKIVAGGGRGGEGN